MASLDQSLDEIVSSRRKDNRKGGRPVKGRKSARVASKSNTGPVTNGVKKNGKTSGPRAVRPVSALPQKSSGISKIIVSNLPIDVTEDQVKEYFQSTVGPIRRVQITYGPDGKSRGIAMIIFTLPDSATKAMEKHNGVKVDNKPMRIEVVIDAKTAKPTQPLNERIVPNEPQAKGTGRKVNSGKTPVAPKATAPRGRREKGQGGKPQRRKAKTADELDAEMVDYFEAPAPTATAEPASNGSEVAMDIQ